MVNLSAWVRPLVNIPATATANMFTIALYFDGVAVVTFSPVRSDVNVWKQISTSTPITVASPGNHVFKIVVTSKGYPNSNVIYADDVSITPVVDTTGIPYCT
jgi:hypothetical protein